MARSIFLSQIKDTGNILASLTTANLVEGSNLYFTNARVYSNIIALLPTLAGTGITIQANGQINSNTTLTFATLSPFLTTSNVAEGSNLYYTNARVISAISGNVTVAALNVTNTTASTSKTTGAVTIAGGLGVAGTIYGNRQDITGPFGNIYLTEYTGLYVQKDSGTGMIQLSTDRFANGIGWQVFSATDPAMYSSGNIYFRVGATLRDQDTVSGGSTPVVIAPTGIFSTGVVSATGNVLSGNVITTAIQANIWTGLYTANVLETNSNLYYNNTRVYSNILALLPTLAGSGINIQANGQINANTQSVSLTGLSTTNLAEGSNLYYTNTRARTAFTAGKGISILGDGTIKSTAAGGEYNISLTGASTFNVSNVMSGVTFNGQTSADRFILRSIQVTNISDSNAAYVSSNVLYSTGNTAYLGNLISVPLGGMVEFMSRTQILQSGDSINLQGFDNNFTPTSNILSTYITYETITNDTSYVGTGQTLATANANILLVSADTTDFIVESIKFVNLKPTNIPIRLYVANTATTLAKGYLAYNTQIPAGSSLEVLQSPKVLKQYDSIYARYANSSNADSIAVFTSYRKAEQTTVGYTTATASIGNTVITTFNTSVPEGTVLYYTIR